MSKPSLGKALFAGGALVAIGWGIMKGERADAAMHMTSVA